MATYSIKLFANNVSVFAKNEFYCQCLTNAKNQVAADLILIEHISREVHIIPAGPSSSCPPRV